MPKPKAVTVAVPKSRETIESDVEMSDMDSDNLDEQSSSEESSEESSSSEEEEDGKGQATSGSTVKKPSGKKNGKWP
jgi:hypothetical protein